MEKNILLAIILAFSVSLMSQVPAYYDLRPNYVTTVKNQDPTNINCGSCWAFASIASLESNWLFNSYVTSVDLSEDNVVDCHGFLETPCQGGSYYMVNALFSRHEGPLSEKVDPNTSGISDCIKFPFTPLPEAYVEDMLLLPNDINTIKKELMKYGAVATSMYFTMSNYSTKDYKYYDSSIDATEAQYGHCVTIVGWNDTLSFKGTTKKGGWIIKDSYGTKWANGGYFYVSFYDAGILTAENIVFPKRLVVDTVNRCNVYYNDYYGWIDNRGFNTSTASALVKYKIGQTGSNLPQQIKRIGTYAVEENENITIEIYKNFLGGRLSNLIASKSINCRYRGIYTIPFDLPTISANTDVYIKVIYNGSKSLKNPIPVETAEINHTPSSIQLSGNSWISSTGNTWIPIGSGQYLFDLCVKMYSEDASMAEISMLPKNICEGENLDLISNSFPANSFDKWYVNGIKIGEGRTLSVPVLKPNFKYGNNKIELVSNYGKNSDTAFVNIYMNPIYLHNIDTLIPENDSILIGGEYRTQEGTYIEEMKSIYGCDSVVSYNITFNTSINKSKIESDIKIFPNPANEKLNILFDKVYKNIEVEIYTQDGRLIMNNVFNNLKERQIDLYKIQPGIYIVKINIHDTGIYLIEKITVL